MTTKTVKAAWPAAKDTIDGVTPATSTATGRRAHNRSVWSATPSMIAAPTMKPTTVPPRARSAVDPVPRAFERSTDSVPRPTQNPWLTSVNWTTRAAMARAAAPRTLFWSHTERRSSTSHSTWPARPAVARSRSHRPAERPGPNGSVPSPGPSSPVPSAAPAAISTATARPRVLNVGSTAASSDTSRSGWAPGAAPSAPDRGRDPGRRSSPGGPSPRPRSRSRWPGPPGGGGPRAVPRPRPGGPPARRRAGPGRPGRPPGRRCRPAPRPPPRWSGARRPRPGWRRTDRPGRRRRSRSPTRVAGRGATTWRRRDRPRWAGTGWPHIGSAGRPEPPGRPGTPAGRSSRHRARRPGARGPAAAAAVRSRSRSCQRVGHTTMTAGTDERGGQGVAGQPVADVAGRRGHQVGEDERQEQGGGPGGHLGADRPGQQDAEADDGHADDGGRRVGGAQRAQGDEHRPGDEQPQVRRGAWPGAARRSSRRSRTRSTRSWRTGPPARCR